jgi:hypothetical protein
MTKITIFSLDLLLEMTGKSVNELHSFYVNECESTPLKFCKHFGCGGSVLHCLIKRHFWDYWENESNKIN